METLTCELDDGVAVLTLNRPERLNVMNLTMRDELGDVLTGLARDDAVRALVVTGAGDAFCAGGDVNDFSDRAAVDMHELMRRSSHRWFRALWQLAVPTIAAVNGVAAAGGASVALACDVVIAAKSARFGQTFQKVGLMPDLGALFTLPRAIGLHRAKALCLSGELIGAQRARELGFVHEVVAPDALMPRVLELARRMSAGPPEAYAAAKSILNRSFELSMDEMLELELYAQSFLFSTPEHQQRLHGFLHRGVTA